MKILRNLIIAGSLFLPACAFAQVQGAIQPAATPPSQTASGTFANKPAASAGALYLATDLGTHGVLLISDGSVWKPATGSAVIAQVGTSQTPLTGTTSETNIVTLSVPAGLLSANGSLRVVCTWTVTNNADAKNLINRFGTSANPTTGGNTAFLNYTGATSAISVRTFMQFTNRNSVSSQVGLQANNFGWGASTLAVAAGSQNTASATFLNINGTLGVGSDSITLEAYTVEWIEP